MSVDRNQFKNDSGRPSRAESGTQCWKCKYELGGLDTAGVCPECGHWVTDTIESIRDAPVPWPAWLRLLRSLYFAAVIILVVSPWLARELWILLGMSRTWPHSQFDDALHLCVFALLPLAFILFVALEARRHALAWLVAFSYLVVVWLLLLPAPGRTRSQDTLAIHCWVTQTKLTPSAPTSTSPNSPVDSPSSPPHPPQSDRAHPPNTPPRETNPGTRASPADPPRCET